MKYRQILPLLVGALLLGSSTTFGTEEVTQTREEDGGKPAGGMTKPPPEDGGKPAGGITKPPPEDGDEGRNSSCAPPMPDPETLEVNMDGFKECIIKEMTDSMPPELLALPNGTAVIDYMKESISQMVDDMMEAALNNETINQEEYERKMSEEVFSMLGVDEEMFHEIMKGNGTLPPGIIPGTDGSSETTSASGNENESGSSGSAETTVDSETENESGTSGSAETTGEPGSENSSDPSGSSGTTGDSETENSSDPSGSSGTTGDSETENSSDPSGSSGNTDASESESSSGSSGSSGNTDASESENSSGSSENTGASESENSAGTSGSSDPAGSAGTENTKETSGAPTSKYANILSEGNTEYYQDGLLAVLRYTISTSEEKAKLYLNPSNENYIAEKKVVDGLGETLGDVTLLRKFKLNTIIRTKTNEVTCEIDGKINGEDDVEKLKAYFASTDHYGKFESKQWSIGKEIVKNRVTMLNVKLQTPFDEKFNDKTSPEYAKLLLQLNYYGNELKKKYPKVESLLALRFSPGSTEVQTAVYTDPSSTDTTTADVQNSAAEITEVNGVAVSTTPSESNLVTATDAETSGAVNGDVPDETLLDDQYGVNTQVKSEANPDSEVISMDLFLNITVPGLLAMTMAIVCICCCVANRNSFICKMCDSNMKADPEANN